MPAGFLLQQLWAVILVHLVQSTLVLGILFPLGWALRRAPARVLHGLWWAGLAKLLLPLPLLGRASGDALPRIIDGLRVTGLETAPVSAWLAGAALFIDPTEVVLSGPTGISGFTSGLLWALTALWVSGASWLGIRWLRSPVQRSAGGTSGRHPVSPDVRRRLARALRGSGVPRQSLEVVAGPVMPSVVGVLHPRILVSETVVRGLSVRELRGVLLHEDAHRRRHDPLLILIQRLAIVLFFYYPPLWVLLRRIRKTGEIACDEAALRRGTSAASYARALARTVRLGLAPACAPAVLGGGIPSLLRDRLRHLRRERSFNVMRRHRFALAAVILLVLFSSLLPSLPAAVTEKEQPVPPRVIPETMVRPEYPEEAREAGIGGRIILSVHVTALGLPDSVAALEEVDEWPSLTASAIAAVRQWRFEPAVSDGEPAETTIRVPIEFAID